MRADLRSNNVMKMRIQLSSNHMNIRIHLGRESERASEEEMVIVGTQDTGNHIVHRPSLHSCQKSLSLLCPPPRPASFPFVSTFLSPPPSLPLTHSLPLSSLPLPPLLSFILTFLSPSPCLYPSLPFQPHQLHSMIESPSVTLINRHHGAVAIEQREK